MSDQLTRFEHLLDGVSGRHDVQLTDDACLKLLDLTETLLASQQANHLPAEIWHRFLEETGRPRFLKGLQTRQQRCRWADVVFHIIRISEYSLLRMFEARVAAYPDRTLFQETVNGMPVKWSYGKIAERIRTIAGIFHTADFPEPRVAILAGNSLDEACCDLACLMYDIFDTPLSQQLDVDVLSWIFNRLEINIAVADTFDNVGKLQEVRKRTQASFVIYTLDPQIEDSGENIRFLGKLLLDAASGDARRIPEQRRRFSLDDPATVMFTSGSTGVPQGVAFSQYHLLTKRFARAAALPDVGSDEVLFCYLPLCHTFGRYLEMLGMIYWGGTYVFADNPSVETLLTRLPQIEPTGLIGIPLRWMQIQQQCFKTAGDHASPDRLQTVFREIVGSRLRWGLSAAGYLDPKVFRFFHRHGVFLCSGFGMTEATGGITMTPPEEYVENSVGIPLPGVEVHFSDLGEMQLTAPYVGEYLPRERTGAAVVERLNPDNPSLLKTGDIFRQMKDGHLEFVDRIKAIYKNSRGQTIAPLKVESKFDSVPGIRRTFLVGDGRAYNVLLIAPDESDSVLEALEGKEDREEARREYFHQIVMAANRSLAPYERVVNFALLNRDFNAKEELTPKGSYRRKIIEENLRETIEELYRERYIELEVGRRRLRIPRWFYRDLGILEDDIILHAEGLLNRRTERVLRVREVDQPDYIRIGDLSYRVNGPVVDLGIIARQPLMWVGNPAVVGFCPCKEGWDVALEMFNEQVLLQDQEITGSPDAETSQPDGIRDSRIVELHRRSVRALFSSGAEALQAVEELSGMLTTTDLRISQAAITRLKALARHPDEEIRCLAYRVLLNEMPESGDNASMMPFLWSGLSFLNEGSIDAIAGEILERHRLEALRRRLHYYRRHLEWPAPSGIRRQLLSVFDLLNSFVRSNPDYYASVRAELSAWIVLEGEPDLSSAAEKTFNRLAEWYERDVMMRGRTLDADGWSAVLVFEDIEEEEIQRLREIFIGTSFLKQSVALAFDHADFEEESLVAGGVWISDLSTHHNNRHYRVSVNTKSGSHYDLQLILQENIDEAIVRKTNYWWMALAGFPYGASVLPQFGCCRPELGVMSTAMPGNPDIWERIRLFASSRAPGQAAAEKSAWRKYYVRAMAAFFQGWLNSGRKIIPGAVAPANIAVSPLDYREDAEIVSVWGWREYRNTLDLVLPMVRTFYMKTAAAYPWCVELLEYQWIFEACAEVLGQDEAVKFLEKLKSELKNAPLPVDHLRFMQELNIFLERMPADIYVPLPVWNAEERYEKWKTTNDHVALDACRDTANQLSRLYDLNRFSDLFRYHYYRYSYFRDADVEVREAFDRLLLAMRQRPETPATRLVELSDLQSALSESVDRRVFADMVFPAAPKRYQIEVTADHDSAEGAAMIRTHIRDRFELSYIIREPVNAAEIGSLYRLFFAEHYLKSISEMDQHLVVADSNDRVVGGIFYRRERPDIVHLESIVVASPLQHRGIGTALLEDFCIRMIGQKTRVVKTHYFMRRFCIGRGFQVDRRWGGLVRFLNAKETVVDDEKIKEEEESTSGEG